MAVDDFANPWTEASEMWILNPGRSIDICFDMGIVNFVFTQRTYQFKRNMSIAPRKLLDFAARGRPWRALLVEYDAKVSLLYTSEKGWVNPTAVYPSWSVKNDTYAKLKRLCYDYPEPGKVVGKFWGDETEYKAVESQSMTIMIRNPPHSQLEWQAMMGYVADMKRHFPHIRFHIHGGKSLARTMGISVDAFDHPVTIDWIEGTPRLLLPNGQIHDPRKADARRDDHWAKLIGENMAQFRRSLKRDDRLDLSRSVYRFNLKSLIWARKNQNALYGYQAPLPDEEVDFETPDERWAPKLTGYRPRMTELGDKWLCDTCTVASRCPYSRAGAICIVDGTEANKLSEKFKSRKSSDIIDGISTLLGANTERLEKALHTEQEMAAQTGQYRLSPQVTTLANGIFDRAIQMARLMDPNIAGQMSQGSRVNIGIMNPNAGAVAGATNVELMAGVAAKLEQFGIPLAEATQEQVEAVIRGDDPPLYPKAIEVGSDDDDDDDDF